MPIIGFNFDKVEAEKKNPIKGKISIKHNFGVKKLEEEKLPIGKSEKALRADFEYNVSYEPKIGSISIKGNLLLMEDPKKHKEILNSWKKDKKIPTEIMSQMINAIILRCNIKALTLSQDVNLPPHIPLPRLTKKNAENYIG